MKTFPQKDVYKNVHSSLIHNSPKLELPISSKMDKQIVIYS